jgi:3-oxoacyl-[acyl-carrier protein] reductase
MAQDPDPGRTLLYERVTSTATHPIPKGSALVTGGSRGIGAAAALALAERGWDIGVNCRSDIEGAERTAALVEQRGVRAIVLAGDVAAVGTADALVRRLEEAFGPVLVLVNNAGIRADGLTPHISDDDWGRVLDTNLTAAFRLTRRVLPGMIRARFGRVVNVASVVGPSANPGQSNYAAAKAGLVGFTKTVGAEVARRGVTVNAVAPGLIDTEMTSDLNGDLAAKVPARRAGTPEDVAACIAFLASPEAAYVTATTLTVDGGMSA